MHELDSKAVLYLFSLSVASQWKVIHLFIIYFKGKAKE